ncbi:hypothetical protein [Sodalis sp. dw_96]|uniref:hypothetical protein n=1 Tax=Sodalis sp. dw_96 TaxID=2719794 RepID=UPI001BD631A5|nr:hypothetical protein [Sodalis sp. dw_96]
MTTIGMTTTGALRETFGKNLFDVSPKPALARNLTRARNFPGNTVSGNRPIRANSFSGANKTTKAGNASRGRSLSLSNIFSDGEESADNAHEIDKTGDDRESSTGGFIDSAMDEGKLPSPQIDLDDFKHNFEKTSLELFFAAPGQHKGLQGWFKACNNDIVLTRLKRIATVYSLAYQAAPNPESMKTVNKVMAQLINKISADKLDDKSIFGTRHSSRQKAYFKVLDLENQLVAALSEIVGEGPLAAGHALRTSGANPFIRSYIEQKLGKKLTEEQAHKIGDLFDSAALAQWDAVFKGIEHHKSAKIDNVCAAINMVLKLPNLLRDIDLTKVDPPPSAEVFTDNDPRLEPASAGVEGGEPVFVHKQDDKGASTAGNTYNITIHANDNSIHLNRTTYYVGGQGTQYRTNDFPKPASAYFKGQTRPQPASIGIQADPARPQPQTASIGTQADPVGPQPQTASIGTQTDNVRHNPQSEASSSRQVYGLASNIIGSRPVIFQGAQLVASLMRVSGLDLQRTGVSNVVFGDKHVPQVGASRIEHAQVHHVPLSGSDATVGRVTHVPQASASRIEHAHLHHVPLSGSDAAAGRVTHVPQASASRIEHAQLHHVPLSGSDAAAGRVTHVPQASASRIENAQLHHVPLSGSDAAVSNDKPVPQVAMTGTAQKVSRPVDESQPVMLTNQGRQLSQLPRKQPVVRHFAPLNEEKVDLIAARNRLKASETNDSSPRLDAYNLRDEGIQTEAGASRASLVDKAAAAVAQSTTLSATLSATLSTIESDVTRSTVIYSQPAATKPAQFAASLVRTPARDLPLTGQAQDLIDRVKPLAGQAQALTDPVKPLADLVRPMTDPVQPSVDDKHLAPTTGSATSLDKAHFRDQAHSGNQAQNMPQSGIGEAMDNDKPAVQGDRLTTAPINPQPAVSFQPTVLSAQGLRRANHTHGNSGVINYVPMNELPEALPTLSNGEKDYTSKRLAAFKPRGNGIKQNSKS